MHETERDAKGRLKKLKKVIHSFIKKRYIAMIEELQERNRRSALQVLFTQI